MTKSPYAPPDCTHQLLTSAAAKDPHVGRCVDRAAVHRARIPAGVAVDTAGNVYVADWGGGRGLKLAAGSATREVLPFSGHGAFESVAVDAAGNLYVTEHYETGVVKLPAGDAPRGGRARLQGQSDRGNVKDQALIKCSSFARSCPK